MMMYGMFSSNPSTGFVNAVVFLSLQQKTKYYLRYQDEKGKRNTIIMKNINCLFALGFLLLASVSAFTQTMEKPKNADFDAELAKKLGADQYGMKSYVLVVLKTGPRDTEFKGKERDDLFAGHLANIKRLAAEGKLALAGPFAKNDKDFRGLFIFSVMSV